MKAILVMEHMPKSCDDCYLCVEYGGCCRCVATGEVMAKPHKVKPDGCPLIPMPERAEHPDYGDNGRFDKGWNACLEEIQIKGR